MNEMITMATCSARFSAQNPDTTLHHTSTRGRPLSGRLLSIALALHMLAIAVALGAAEPAGLWEFDDRSDLLKASIGKSLQLRGQHEIIPGPSANNGAVRIGVGSYYICTHGIAPQGTDSLVNRYSLAIDYRVADFNSWRCFFQTSPANNNDGDCFIRPGDGMIGVSQTGYSTVPTDTGSWERLIVSVDNSQGQYCIYLDGNLILKGAAQAVDQRFALAPTVLLFADDNDEDGAIDIARIAIYNICLSAAEAAALGGVPTDGTNEAPVVSSSFSGPAHAAIGQECTFQVGATDPNNDRVQVRMDWGDSSGLSPWSSLNASGSSAAFSHTYKQPGVYPLRALAQDEYGKTGQWLNLGSIQITGSAIVSFLTPPYLQNVTPDGIVIMWELDYATAAEVEYGPTDAYGKRASSTATPSGAGTQIYRCVITGLAPGSTCHYRVNLANQQGPSGTFATSPPGSPDFAFSVWSDSQGSNHGTYADDPLEPTKSMFRHMIANGISIAIAAGDMAESGASYSDTRMYYLDRVASILGTAIPWFVAWGNHDGDPSSVIRKFADFPSKNRAGFNAGYGSYSFDYAGCHFIAIDNASSSSDIIEWLESDLKSESNRNARLTFLFIHVPPFCEIWLDGDEFLRSKLTPLMEQYGVDACFSGHTHEYERGFRNGVYYCITGGGSWLDTPETQVKDWPFMTVGGFSSIPGITRPRPDAGGGLINEYVRVEVSGSSFTASMIGFTPDGKEVGVLDRFSNSLTPAGDPPATPVVTGPATLDVFASNELVLRSSAFSDPNPGDSLMQCQWRLNLSTTATNMNDILWEGVTTNLECAIATTNLTAGKTVYAFARHVASDGLSSPFSAPLAIHLIPDPLFAEDFEATEEFSLPPGWTADQRTSIDVNSADPNNPQSNTYLTWTVVTAERLGAVMGTDRVNVPSVVQGKSVYAESDHRNGRQIQYLTTPDIDLKSASNVVVSFRSNYMQNQDSLAALEYSLDGGAAWLPVAYYLDEQDVIRNETGQIDAAAVFTRVDPDGVPTISGTSSSGGTYGEHILCRPFSSLGAFINPRINDSATDSKRIERYRLPDADGHARARFRFTLVGTGSWFWGIDDFSLFGSLQELPRIMRITAGAGIIELEWNGDFGPLQIQTRPRLDAGQWENQGSRIGAGIHSIQLPVSSSTAFYRLILAR